LGVGGCGGKAGADRPDRFVGQHHFSHLGTAETGETRFELPDDLGFGLFQIAFFLRLAECQNRNHAVLEDGLGLGVDLLVGLAKQLSALAVAANHIPNLQLAEHCG